MGQGNKWRDLDDCHNTHRWSKDLVQCDIEYYHSQWIYLEVQNESSKRGRNGIELRNIERLS